jgi:phage-related minor tail protein
MEAIRLRVTLLVQAVMEGLMNRVHVQTRIDVQKVREKCDLLPLMNQKLDTIIGLQREQSDKMDQILQLQAQKNRRESAALRKESSVLEHVIPADKIKKEPQPLAGGASSKVYKVIQ